MNGWMHSLIGWGVFLGFVLAVLTISLFAAGVHHGHIKIRSPFGPLIRYTERRQANRHELQKMRLQLQLRRDNPDYTEFLERKRDQP